jgi:predicted anti-sigma-YlaC factor YlaD
LYLEVEEMMKIVGKEQAGAVAIEMRANELRAKAARRRRKRIQYKIMCWSLSTLAVVYLVWLVWAVVQIRIENNPELGVCLLPKGSWGYKQYNNLKWVDCEPK